MPYHYSNIATAFAHRVITSRITAAATLRQRATMAIAMKCKFIGTNTLENNEYIRRQFASSTCTRLQQRRRQLHPLSSILSSSTFSQSKSASLSPSTLLWMKSESFSSQTNWDEEEIIREEKLNDIKNIPSATTTPVLTLSKKTKTQRSSITIKGRYCRSRLLFLKGELIRLSGGNKDFNPNSPIQRSMAIFGEVRSCTKVILKENALPISDLSDDKRLLAEYILEYLDLLKLQQQENSQEQGQQLNNHHHTDTSSQATISNTPKTIFTLNQDLESTTTNTVRKATAPVHKKMGKGRKDGRRQTRQQRQRPITYEEIVEGLFEKESSLIDPYWKEPLLELSRPVGRDIVKQLNPTICPMGYDPDRSGSINNNYAVSRTKKSGPTRGKRVGFLGFCRDQKELFPQHVILVRCGDFYETFGIEAIMLMEHVGLNPMGGKARSGCPKQNIQATLDGLTQQGFSVAVYEEISSTSKPKDRSLAQIVSPASPTYLYDNWLLGGGSGGDAGRNDPSYSLDGLPPPRPCVGVVHTAAGYNIIEVSLEERSIQYSERLTCEAVACRLATYPPADPLLYIPSRSEEERGRSGAPPTPSFLPKRGSKGIGSHRLRTKIINPHLVPEPSPGRSDADRYIHAIVDTLLKMNELQTNKNVLLDNNCETNNNDSSISSRNPGKQTSVSDFTVTMASTSTNPLYVETAMQIGLMDDKTIPSLIQHVLDDAAPATTRRFLHRYLLIPPPPSVAQSMACVVKTLIDKDNAISLPPLTIPNLGKTLILIRAGQAGAIVYGELLQGLDTTMSVLGMYENDSDDNENNETTQLFIYALLHMCQHESGLPANKESLLERCREAVAAIESVISLSYHVENECVSKDDDYIPDKYIPDEFFERNERSWRGRVQQVVAENAYHKVHSAAQKLRQAVKEDFIGSSESNKSLIKYNFFDNLIGLKEIPREGFEDEISFIHPSDRLGKKVLSNRWTTEKVKQTVSRYVTECENAAAEVASILSTLARDLQDDGHIPAIVQSSHFNLILSTAFHHAVKATNSKWELANTIEDSSSQPASKMNNKNDQHIMGHHIPSSAQAHFVDIFPYWMHRSKAVSNTFDLSSMILLTAPNMSGKSTLMRSTAAAALLTVCGLCAPLSSESKISRFDTLFLRGASADIPTEDKSAFGAEMGDLAALFRCSGSKSFVFVDELGRGTSPRDGTRLAGAVLERMSDLGMSGIFATHLHDVLDLPLRKDRIITKRIKIEHDEKTGSYEWTHKLEDGKCRDSMALVTAEQFGLPEEIIRRAEELTQFLPKRTNNAVVTNITNGGDNDSDSIDSLKVEQSDDGNIITVDGIEDEFVPLVPESSIASTKSQSLKQQKQDKEHRRMDFKNVIDLASKLISVETTPIQIPPRHHPPASLSNRSCLYVLQLALPSSSSPSSSNSRYYIGETDSLSKRLSQHRRKGSIWSHSNTVVFPVKDKTQARYWESTLIGELARAGYSLESIADGRTLRHFRD